MGCPLHKYITIVNNCNVLTLRPHLYILGTKRLITAANTLCVYMPDEKAVKMLFSTYAEALS